MGEFRLKGFRTMGHWRSLRRGDISSAGQGVGLAHALAQAAAKLLGIKPAHARHLPPQARLAVSQSSACSGVGALSQPQLPLGKHLALLPVVAGDGDPHQLEL